MSAIPGNAFRSPLLIRFSHCDPAGIVYFARYFDLFNGLVEDWFNQHLGLDYADMLLNQHLGMPVIHAECQFIRPSRMGEELTLVPLIERIGETSVTLDIRAYRGDELRLKARMTIVSTSIRTFTKQPLPADLRAALVAYQAACAADA